MPYTVLRLTDAGVVLLDYHLARLGLAGDDEDHEDHEARAAFDRFAATAAPGNWAVFTDGEAGLRVEERPASRLYDGIPTRSLPSPVADRSVAFPKPAQPGPYEAVRQPGVATLLTSADGRELYESCTAAVLHFDGATLLVASRGRPRVLSTAEAALRDHLSAREGVIPGDSNALLLVNAVKGTCALAEPRSTGFPTSLRREIDALFARLTRRPDATGART
ncbi:MAG: hypothetical protein IT371_19620 [Deltaproteobacteria bacterium]|nr:hypothetical protein [Deltaproteobacteria bacterium]